MSESFGQFWAQKPYVQGMPKRECRSFSTSRRLPSGRYQVRYTGPDKIRRNAPHTFAARIDAEAWIVAKRRDIDREVWDADDDDPAEHLTFSVYSERWLANRQVAGRPIKARTREHYAAILKDHLLPVFGYRQLTAIRPQDVRDWHAKTLADRPTMRSHAYGLFRTIMGSAVNEELIDANPARIVGAGRSKRVHQVRPASVEEIAVLTAQMPEKLRLMVTIGVVVRPEVRGDSRTAPRRHRPQPRGDTGPAGSRPHQGHLQRDDPQVRCRDAGRRHTTAHHPAHR